MPKNARTIAQSLSAQHASKAMLKILQARLQQYMNHELPDVQACFIKGRRIRDKIAIICWITEKVGSQKKQESSRKIPSSALLTMQSLSLCGSQQTVENSSRDGNTRLADLPPEKYVCRSRSHSSNWTWNRLVPNRKRSTSRLYIVIRLI